MKVPKERTWPRVTGLDLIDEPLHRFRETEPASISRRVLYAFLIGVGITMTAFGSLLFTQMIGPIPLKWWPDIRPVLTMGYGLLLGLQGGWGSAKRRRVMLYGVLLIVVLFHLEEATVHWIGPFPGSITGTRVGLLGTAGSLIAILGVLLMHVEVESERLRQDAVERGSQRQGAAALVEGLRRQGNARMTSMTLGIAGIGLLVFVGEKLFGNEATGGSWVLLVGGGILLLLAYLFTRWTRDATAQQPQQLQQRQQRQPEQQPDDVAQ